MYTYASKIINKLYTYGVVVIDFGWKLSIYTEMGNNIVSFFFQI